MAGGPAPDREVQHLRDEDAGAEDRDPGEVLVPQLPPREVDGYGRDDRELEPSKPRHQGVHQSVWYVHVNRTL